MPKVLFAKNLINGLIFNFCMFKFLINKNTAIDTITTFGLK